ncbi:MAG: TetR/AcrR family transcriptional regulator [Polyangiales bacterium]
MPDTDGRSRKDPEGTRAAIVDAALTLFAERGPAGATLADIAVAVGLSKGAVTHHFDSKDALVDVVLARCADALTAAADGAVSDADPPLARARALLSAWWSPPEPAAPLRVFASLSALAAHDPRLAGAVTLHSAGVIALLARRLDDALSAAGARPAVPTEELARWALATAVGLALLQPPTADARRAAEAAVVALMRW